jgi:hypothetical protein
METCDGNGAEYGAQYLRTHWSQSRPQMAGSLLPLQIKRPVAGIYVD